MALDRFLLMLILVLLFARVMAQLAERVKQPPVLGELLAGVLLGASVLGWVPDNEILHLLAEVGVMLLLFEIGLETDLSALLRVGAKSLTVALIGIALPFAGGYLTCVALGITGTTAILFGAAFCATSIGITARVLADLGVLNSTEGRIVLGAAVLDDVLGLVILAVVSAIVAQGSVSALFVVQTTVVALAFVATALLVGRLLAPSLLRIVDRMTVRGALVTAALVMAFAFALAAKKVGSAAIVGSFAAGLVLSSIGRTKQIEHELKPIADFFTPIFFVSVGVAVNVRLFNPLDAANRSTLVLASLGTLVAFFGKFLAGWGAWGKGVRHALIGAGMVPRGEVGLIFATVGKQNGVLDDAHYAALLAVIFLTTFVAPILLAYLAKGSDTEKAPGPA
ncbi:High-affinity Na(+)/H(+) antiporter NhaS3 [bacterium HR16]|nr:High-affinity Na(+)/H(+) antiporter NhaS3 [bacterium HR16]